MLALCSMLWHTYYAQNYASIIGPGLLHGLAGGPGAAFSTLKTRVERWLPLSSFVLLAVASMSKTVSRTASKVRFALASRAFWIASLLSPHTNWSLKASERKSPNLQVLASFLRLVRYSATDSPDF